MKPLIFELVSESTWKARTPFGINYTVLDHGSYATMLAPDATRTECNDIYDAMEAVRVDFEERTLECLGASEALRRTNDTIRKAERITRANPSLANLFEDLLQLARVRSIKGHDDE